MHEYSLIANLLAKIDAVAREQHATRVVGVAVWIGALAHLSAGHFREHFDSGSRGSVAEGARLEVITAPGSGWCKHCETSVALSEVFGACPQCGALEVRVTGGTQMRVKEIEVG